jgi:hypothetical protein
MGATVLLPGTVRLVWYGFSGFSVLSSVLLNWWSGLASLYSVRQKYVTILQHSCESNRWRGEFVLERSSGETQSTSVAMEC